KAGMDDYVTKPIDPSRLWETLLKWIKPHSIIDEAAASTDVEVLPVSLPAGIKGVDIESGLSRVLGNSGLYLSLLKKFMYGNRETAINIRTAIESGDFVTAERIAHTLKGVSAGLGAMHLYELSALLESAFRQNRSSAELLELLKPLEAVLDEIIGTMMNEPALQETEKVPVVVD
ncbi:MAG: Hpt domain-containing protein, partial [Desulfuromonadaceae bacterium]|nr:Hpt domain-containing protein [Desulfuromonadaceae bacterium]